MGHGLSLGFSRSWQAARIGFSPLFPWRRRPTEQEQHPDRVVLFPPNFSPSASVIPDERFVAATMSPPHILHLPPLIETGNASWILIFGMPYLRLFKLNNLFLGESKRNSFLGKSKRNSCEVRATPILTTKTYDLTSAHAHIPVCVVSHPAGAGNQCVGCVYRRTTLAFFPPAAGDEYPG